jgi:hypothetical protein
VGRALYLEKIKIPATHNGKAVTAIASMKNSAVTELSIPAHVKEIKSGAFVGCNGLDSVIIPSTVTKIGKGAFDSCERLSVYLEAEMGEGYEEGWSGDVTVFEKGAWTYVDGKPSGEYLLPVKGGSVTHEHKEFYHNQTLNNYYEHVGIDVAAEVGAKVVARTAGVIKSVSVDDLLDGPTIVIETNDGKLLTYMVVDFKEGLKVGDSVARGQVIGYVAEPTGNEYKDGPHIHFEMSSIYGEQLDPKDYIKYEKVTA